MGELRGRVLEDIKKRRERVINGEINAIPSPFKRFSDDFIGIEQGVYYLITAATKNGKSQLSSFVFLYNTIMYSYNHPEQATVKIFYYPLEEPKDAVMRRFMSHLIYSLSGKIVSPTDLKSVKENSPLSQDIIDLLESEEYTKIIDYFESCIEFSDSKNPTGVYSELKKWAEDNGTTYYKPKKIKDEFGQIQEVKGFDYYEPNNPNLYTIIYIDHISLMSPEKGMTLKQTIDKTSEYCIQLRNKYNFTPVIIQQQSVEGESTDSIKMNRIRPTLGNLSDSKYTSKDAQVVLGIFSPIRYDLDKYMGYDVKIMKDNIRILELIVGRDGSPGSMIGLYFDGRTCSFKELPHPDNITEINRVYDFVKKQRSVNKSFFSLGKIIKNIFN